MEEEKKLEEEIVAEKKGDDAGVTPAPEGLNNAIELNNSPEPVEGDGEGELADGGKNLDPVEPQPDTDEQKAVEKLFTQSEVNDIVSRRVNETREKAHNDTIAEILEGFGVENLDVLKNLAGDGQRFPALQEEFSKEKKSAEDRISELEKNLGDVSSELALWKSGIDPERYEDCKLILTGKGLEINADNIKSEMATHPEWVKKEPEPVKISEPEGDPVSKITRLGNGKGVEGDSELDAAMDLFDIKK